MSAISLAATYPVLALMLAAWLPGGVPRLWWPLVDAVGGELCFLLPLFAIGVLVIAAFFRSTSWIAILHLTACVAVILRAVLFPGEFMV